MQGGDIVKVMKSDIPNAGDGVFYTGNTPIAKGTILCKTIKR